MLKLNSLTGFSAKALEDGGGGGPPGGNVEISQEDSGDISSLPVSVGLGSAETGRVIIVAYFNVTSASGAVPSNTSLTLGGNSMTRVSTIISGLSGNPEDPKDGYNCTFFHLQVNTGTSATLARSGGTTSGKFAVFRMTGHDSATPNDTAGHGTTSDPVTSYTNTLDIPEDGAMIAAAYAITSSSHTYTGASRVLNGFVSAALKHTNSIQNNYDVECDRGSLGGLFFISASWG